MCRGEIWERENIKGDGEANLGGDCWESEWEYSGYTSELLSE